MLSFYLFFFFFFFNDTATTEIYTLSLHDALPISGAKFMRRPLTLGAPATAPSSTWPVTTPMARWTRRRSEEHTSELQSLRHLVCRLLLEKKKYRVKQATLPLHNIQSDELAL